MELLTFPGPTLEDIPRALRTLADQIEFGDYGPTVHNVAWVMDAGDGDIKLGLMGRAAAPGAEAYLLLGVAQRILEER
jgi:hypothetical protein